MSRLVPAPRVFVGWAVLCSTVPCAAQPRPWSADLLHDASVWADRMNDAVVSADRAGLRVEIAPGREWAITAIPQVALPGGTGRITVRVREMADGGRWLMRLYGDVRGNGEDNTASLAERQSQPGERRLEPDPRVLALGKLPPVQLQLGIEGPAGAYVVFEGLEFAPGPPLPQPTGIPGQLSIATVELMPNLPQPYRMLDWNAKARAFDRFVFDPSLKGDYLPLVWIDDAHINIDRPTFGLPSYVGDTREAGSNQEGITCMGAVLGATVAGIDKRAQDHDYVLMCEAFYNRRNGLDLVLNNQNQGTGGSFWYELFPHIVFYALADRYPGAGEMDSIVRTTAGRWIEAVDAMGGNFYHTAFNFATMQPVDNGQWKEPDAAAGIACLEYAAYRKFGDQRYLDAATRCTRYLEERQRNPYYENLLPWGTLAAARMNAELGYEWDVERFLNWCFGISDCRGGWAVTVQNWGGYDCAGLLGSVDNMGGYAFAMNTFTQAGALVPLVRYDPRYARAIGKWMLNLANAARLFYPNELPKENQCCGDWTGDPEGVIAYEGLRREWEGHSPYGTGDPVIMKWGPKTDLGLYGSSYVGLLGGIVRTTDVEGILQLDCLATDFYRAPAYPTYLCYNPYTEERVVTIDVGPEPRDLYDAVSHRFIDRRERGAVRLSVPGDRAALLVVTPPGGRETRDGTKLLVDGVIVDYRTG